MEIELTRTYVFKKKIEIDDDYLEEMYGGPEIETYLGEHF